MKYYLLGVGGVSMSALAIFLKEKNIEVSGYDENHSKFTEILQNHGVQVDFSFDKSKIDDADVIAYSSAFCEGNEIFDYAKRANKTLVCRGELLGKISSGYEKVVAVAGSHGKTTTTAMIYEILKVAGKSPTLHLGGLLVEGETNFDVGDKEYFVTEACEYHNNFLFLRPYLSVVTNVEKEHMDFFKTFENQLRSFEKFKENSRFVVDDFGDLQAKNVRHDKNGFLMFDIFDAQKKILHLKLRICEDVNTKNCLFAYKACKALGISNCMIKRGLENFKGVQLRFQKVRSKLFDDCVLDYAHHPSEIKNAISSAKKIYKKRQIYVVFQPHTYSRTKTLLPEFLQTFKNVENVIIFKTYPARENLSQGIDAKNFCEILKKFNKNAKYFENFEKLYEFLKILPHDCVLLFVGAGDLPAILHKNIFVS